MSWVGSQSSLCYATEINLHIKSLAEVKNLKPYLLEVFHLETCPSGTNSMGEQRSTLGGSVGEECCLPWRRGLSWACHFFPQTHQSDNWRFFPWGEYWEGKWGCMLPYCKFFHREMWGEWGVSVPCYHLTSDTLLCTVACQKENALVLWLAYYLVKLSCAEFLSRS